MTEHPSASAQSENLASHVTETVDAIVQFQKAHETSASPLQRVMEGLTERLGRAGFVACVFLALMAWVVATFVLTPGDAAQPSFTWLEIFATVFALFVAMLILVTQRRQDRLSERRAQLTLELAILADRKTAKLIALLEELRRDQPNVRDRTDHESDELAKAADPRSVLAAIDERSSNAGRKAKR